MINNLGSKALETKIDDYMGEYVSDYVSTYMSASNDQIEANRKVLDAGFEDFIVPVYESAPNTTIQNRAQVCRSLKAIAGIERIHIKGVSKLINEFGASGEAVFEADNKDSRVRFVGSGWTSGMTTSGAYIVTATASDYCEITFYGTGLNLVHNVNTTLADFKVSVDGGAFGSNIFVSTYSGVLDARSYNSNVVMPVISSLSLGLHTVRIRLDAGNIRIYGFEIVNQRTDLAVYSGEGLSNGYSNSLPALATSSFSSGISGTRGARVVKYIQNNTINTAVQEVDAAAAYLTSTDHTNEEIVRKINFLEFGMNRADDFSTLTGVASSRAFTLADGTTTLSCISAVYNGSGQGVFTNVTTAPGLSITFVGTGLDIILGAGAGSSPYSDTYNLVIDGVSVGSMPTSNNTNRLLKICSGLSYGTHTVSFQRTLVSVGTWTVTDFIIYQPKKPSVPTAGLEVADFNVLANYAYSATTGISRISTGVLKKANMREITYSGTWTASVVTPNNYLLGFAMGATSSGAYAEYTFWGTGVELVFFTDPTNNSSITIALDGVTANTTNYPSAVFGVTAPATFNSATGILSQAVTNGSGRRLSISNLTLGLHKVRMTSGSATNMDLSAIDVITPIHINDFSLKIGSRSLKSLAKFSPEKVQTNTGPDLSKAKTLLLYNSSTQIITSSMNISSVVRLSTGIIRVFFQKPFKNNNYVCVAVGTTYDCAVTASNTGVDNKRVNSIDLENFLSDTNAWLDTTFNIACFGELADE